MMLSTLIYSYLILYCKRSAFIFGIIASGVMSYILFESGVPIQASLHLIYIIVYLYSFIIWGKKNGELGISNMSKKMWIVLISYILIFSLVMGGVFSKIGTSSAYIDAFSAACSMSAVFLLSMKIIENSYIFIASNIASIYICYMTNDKTAIISFFIYMIFNIIRQYKWEKIRNERGEENDRNF